MSFKIGDLVIVDSDIYGDSEFDKAVGIITDVNCPGYPLKAFFKPIDWEGYFYE